MQARTGIIILNWNNLDETLQCLDQLSRVAPQEAKTIVVDNGSLDGTAQALASRRDIIFIPLPENIGFAAGNNAGIRKALEIGCDYVLLLNNDTLLERGFIEALLHPFESDPRAGISCPKILYAQPANTIWFAGGKFRQPRIIGEMVGQNEVDEGQYNQSRLIDFAVGTCMLISRRTLETIGLMDERLFFYHEDIDFSYRAKEAGFNIWYEPGGKIYHKVAQSTRANLPLRTYLFTRGRVVFFAKHIRGMKILWVISLEIVRSFRMLIGYLIHGRPDMAAGYIKGVFRGMADARLMLSAEKRDHGSIL